MSTLVRWQMIGAAVGLVLAIASLLAAASMKHWVRLPLPPLSAVRWHRILAWGSLLVYTTVSYTCLRYHFPLDDPLAALDFGWFSIHPVNGLVAIPLYLGKLLVVRGWKRGWKTPGLLLGSALMLFWLIQAGTVLPSLLR
jgi:hypothetical protein